MDRARDLHAAASAYAEQMEWLWKAQQEDVSRDRAGQERGTTMLDHEQQGSTPLVFRKSTFSGPNSDMCVEVGDLAAGSRQVRDSKDPDGSVLTFGADEWSAFVKGVKAGQFD